MNRRWLLVLLLAVAGCRDRRPPAAPPAPPAPPAPDATAATATSGLTAGEASRFFHEAIGSDPLPQFVLAELKQPDGRRFLDDLGRFGLLPDPSEEHNEERLPIGMTVHLPFDLQPFNVRFYGFTCAACHVGEVAAGAGRAPVRIIGAPGRFDPARFHRELIAAAEPMFTQLPALLPVMLYYYDEVTRASEDMTDPTGLKRVLLQTTLGPPTNDTGAPAFRDSLRRDLAAVQRAALRLSIVDVVRQDPLLGRAADPPTARIAASAATVRLASASALAPTAWAELSARDRTALVNGLLAETFHVLRLMRARVEHARAAAGAGSAPGPGRVDVLRGLSLVLAAPRDKPPYVPVAAPPLWNSHQLPRIHWDQNTNSIFEHGILMAIALGAPVHPRTHASPIQPRALAAAIQVLPRLRPPAPPPRPADANRLAAGRGVFARECARCHQPGAAGFAVDRGAGTDPARLEEHGAVREPLARLLASVKARAYARASISADEQPGLEAGRTPARWYPSEGYAPRSLAGVWATAPYLHNDSVPGLAELLKSDRVGAGGRGDGSGGHPYGTALGAEEKAALLDYLGSL
jgi:mono/diheme cytochrome c family protein